MSKDFLYCESTQAMIRNNDVVIMSESDHKWIVKHGWFKLNGKQSNGWYLKSIVDGTILPIDTVDLSQLTLATNNSPSEPVDVDVDNLNEGDVVTILGHDGDWVVHYGKYKLGGVTITGWYIQSLDGIEILSLNDISRSDIKLESGSISSSDVMPQATPTYEYIVVPGTNIRLYDNDVVRLSPNAELKYIVHSGWYIYQGVQNYGWYLVSIKNGNTMPVSAINLTTVQLVSSYTQGSAKYDGKKVNYTRPFTEHDGIVLNRTFITVDTIEQRDNLPKYEVTDGRMVRVNTVGSGYAYYVWAEAEKKWKDITFETTLPIVSGSSSDPLILSQLQSGMYIVKGTYKVSTTDTTEHMSLGDTLVTISRAGNLLYIKDLNSSLISDYVVDDNDFVTISTEYVTKQYLQDVYATVEYVDARIQALELDIQAYIDGLFSQIPDMFDKLLSESLHEITEAYVDNLFTEEE